MLTLENTIKIYNSNNSRFCECVLQIIFFALIHNTDNIEKSLKQKSQLQILTGIEIFEKRNGFHSWSWKDIIIDARMDLTF